MERSEFVNELATALAKAQGAMQPALKDANNPFFKSKYADIASVWEACRKPLADNGLSVVQLPEPSENSILLTTILLHSSGQYLSSSLKFPIAKSDPQSYGSALTYARRYALAAAVGVYQDDDDANTASQRDSKSSNVRPNKPQEQSSDKNVAPLIQDNHRRNLFAKCAKEGITSDDLHLLVKWKFDLDSINALTVPLFADLSNNLNKHWSDYIAAQSAAG